MWGQGGQRELDHRERERERGRGREGERERERKEERGGGGRKRGGREGDGEEIPSGVSGVN